MARPWGIVHIPVHLTDILLELTEYAIQGDGSGGGGGG